MNNMLATAWNYQPPVEIRKSVKSRAIAAMVWLLALMLCFTLISRATSSMTVPIVETDNPNRGSINHTVTVDGVLETSRDIGVVVAANAVVQTVNAKEGDVVAAGDLLFTYDTKDFNRQINDYHAQIAKINAQLTASGQQKALDEENRELARQRAEADLETIGSAGDLDVEIARANVTAAGARIRAARDQLDKYDDIRRSELDDDDYEDTEYTLQEYDAFRAELRQAEIAREEAELELEKVMAQKEQERLEAQRVIEDTGRPEAPSATDEILRQDAHIINLQLAVLYEAVANNGEVYAPIDGVVTRVDVGAGTRTTSEAALFINNAETMDFIAEVSKEEKKYVNAGNSVTMRMAGETKDIQGLTVTSVQPSATPNAYRVAIEMPADYLPGTSGSVEIEQKSKAYDTVVPLSALHADGSQYYVMRVIETETSLGTECFAERVDVTLQEKNETYAAVTGALNDDDEIISSTESSIQDGDKVRLQEEE
jgi:multidrug efflux pump subunit AcrA (membrane-fusion protein)